MLANNADRRRRAIGLKYRSAESLEDFYRSGAQARFVVHDEHDTAGRICGPGDVLLPRPTLINTSVVEALANEAGKTVLSVRLAKQP